MISIGSVSCIHTPKTVDNPREKAIGTLKKIKTNKEIKNTGNILSPLSFHKLFQNTSERVQKK